MTKTQYPILGGKPKRFTVALVLENETRRQAGFDHLDAATEYAQGIADRDGFRCLVSDWETKVTSLVVPAGE